VVVVLDVRMAPRSSVPWCALERCQPSTTVSLSAFGTSPSMTPILVGGDSSI
jgi:hypothetical protein